LTKTVALFQNKLHSAKQRLHQDIPWYAYDTLGSWCRLDQMFGERWRRILHQLTIEPLLDIGCADGDLAFFLDSLGHRVHAIDWPATNHNGMRGVRALKTALASSVEIHEVDMDSQFQMPVSDCGLALMLGVLYHLKNPVFVLEKLAQHCRYCIFSTTVTRFTPDRQTDLQDIPVAYLLDDGELNSDPTNHWVFSEACLRRLFKKTHWEILEYATRGNTKKSVPDSALHQLRAFGILKSTQLGDPADGAELLDGWHKLERNRWRWTERCFGVAWEALPQDAGRFCLLLEFHVHERLLAVGGRVKLAATVDDIPLEPAEYRAAGKHVYRRVLDAAAVRRTRVVVRYELDACIQPDAADLRERGLVVTAMDFAAIRGPDPLAEPLIG
jgi:2-polyprenyl-3-methyl-5-hydroxy-6-metoxy-1,4-benzoquinol methylase